jgi:hypothetical protein
MTNEPQIVGVTRVRNEEFFGDWAVANAAAICDRYLVMDNGSTDATRARLEAVAARFPHIEIIDVPDAYDTHKYVEPFADTNTWVLGVDGDEIYDPAGLARVKDAIHAGRFDSFWRVDSATLHVTEMNVSAGRASGYLAPPSRPMTKLYNFSALKSWSQGRHQRLHGKNYVFHDGVTAETVCRDYLETGWDGADLRCLHLCFMPRSPLDGDAAAHKAGRRNPSETMKQNRLLAKLGRLVGVGTPKRTYKQSNYAVGTIGEFGVGAFGVPPHPEAARLLAAGG